jgi:hypothetical protein
VIAPRRRLRPEQRIHERIQTLAVELSPDGVVTDHSLARARRLVELDLLDRSDRHRFTGPRRPPGHDAT